MKSLLIVTISLLNVFFLTASPVQNNSYQYYLDLTKVENDRLSVELITPKINKNKAVFYLPKIVPGTYSVYDFGRFVTDFRAYDRNGKVLQVSHPDVNTWKIKDANRLFKITYKVDDTFDANVSNQVAGMSGTNIEDGKNFLINGFGFFGYFKDMKFQPFELKIKKPEGFAGSSAYNNVKSKEDVDTYSASDYHYFVDMPIMYCVPDTTIIRLGETEVLISVYSPSGAIQTDFLRDKFETLLKSQSSYLSHRILVDRYAFLMYFMGEQLPIGTGALEHNYSSVYCLPDIPQEHILPFLLDISSHEFFHIITPLNIHSEEIHYFDFNDPDMSRHLWMYEGITEYFSHHNQVRSGMIDPDAFLQRIAQKIQNSQTLYDDDLPFTKLSEGCLVKHSNQYGNVYEKGALIGMCLDLELLRLSNGQHGVINLMEDLSKRYGSQTPFKDRKLFKEIEKMTYPEIGDFLKTYVAGKNPIPYGEFFAKAGVAYKPPKDTMVYSLGGINLGFNQETGRLVVSNTYTMNEMGRELGYLVGDEIISIDGKKVPAEHIQAFVTDVKNNMKEGTPLTVIVARKDENGVEKELKLSAITKKVKQVAPPLVQREENPTPAQLTLWKAWTGA